MPSFAYHILLRGDTASSTIRTTSSRTSPETAIDSLNLTKCPNSQQLYAIQEAFDQQSLQRALGISSTTRSDEIQDDDVRASAERLSSCLTQTGSPERAVYREVQLRALVSSLALLHHRKVHTLDNSAWNRLNANIKERFHDITWQIKNASIDTDRIRHTTCVYLVQLASQYLSFIQCGDAKVPFVVGPVVKILFASLSLIGGQYNHTQQILQGFNELFALRQRPQTKYETLCGLQEYTRLATNLLLHETSSPDGTEQVRRAVLLIVTTLMHKLDEILESEKEPSWPEPGTKWHKLLAVLQWGTPRLDRGWYYFGLLDCISQLAALVDPAVLPKSLVSKIDESIYRKASMEFRWKAMEILMSCSKTRADQYEILENKIRETPGIEAYEPKEEPRESLLQLAQTVRNNLDYNQNKGLRFEPSLPLAYTTTPHTIQSSIHQVETSSLSASPTSAPSTPSLGCNSWKEAKLNKSAIADIQSITMRLSSNGKCRRGSSYGHSRLSQDCKRVLFHNRNEVSIIPLKLSLTQSSKEYLWSRVFTKQVKGEHIVNALVGLKWIVIATSKRLMMIDTMREASPPLSDTLFHDKWDPSGLACYEGHTYFTAVLGQRRVNKEGASLGRLKVLKRRIDGGDSNFTMAETYLPDGDVPKTISYDPIRQIITCITKFRNAIILWSIADKTDEQDNSVVRKRTLAMTMLLKDHHDEYTNDRWTGVTSASIYKAQSDHLYAVCTTAPSNEREAHRGEWSYIIPLPTSAAPKLRPPCTEAIHDLEIFKHHRPLRGGCVSSKHNVLAVLEETGKISIMHLQAHKEAGMTSYMEDGTGDDKLIRLPEALCKQYPPLSSCMRFDPSGDRLYAVDPKGRVIIVNLKESTTE